MNKLKLKRIELKLSQIELSEATGVPRYVIQLAEQGVRLPTKKHTEALEEVLGAGLISNEEVADEE